MLVMFELRRSGFQTSSLAAGGLDDPGERIAFVRGEKYPMESPGELLTRTVISRIIQATVDCFKQ